jgi:hypothetical protein
MKFCSVSVNGPRETYFVDEPRILMYNNKRQYRVLQKELYNVIPNVTVWQVL